MHPQNPAIEEATAAMQAAVPCAEADPARPVFHFRSPAQWMTDLNGTFFLDVWYHIFYQFNPYGRKWAPRHWGHARSRDLVHWEHLPIALWPSKELGEQHCLSGGAAFDADGRPVLMYTSVNYEERPNELWAAMPADDDLLVWKKLPDNPILTLANHGGPAYDAQWRDPFLWRDGGRTFMVVGADVDRMPFIAVYECEDRSLVRWTFRGHLPLEDFGTPFPECPNLFRLGEKWVLIAAPDGPLPYVVGDFDPDACTFVVQRRGMLERGGGLYATNLFAGEEGRRSLVGWARGWEPGKSWDGCMGLPRVLSLAGDLTLLQDPAPELEQLRGQHVRLGRVPLSDSVHVVDGIGGGALEVRAVLEPRGSAACGLTLRKKSGEEVVSVSFAWEKMTIGEAEFPVDLEDGEPLDIRLFYDRSLVEVFVNRRETWTGVAPTGGEDVSAEVFAEGGFAAAASVDVWQMKSIW